MDNERGFTLIELLIVLAIMGMLVGITALSLGDLIGTTETTTKNAEMGTVQTAIDVYNTQKALGDPDCAAPIPEQTPLAVQVTGGDTSFGQLLRRTTKYYYEWALDGEDLAASPSGG